MSSAVATDPDTLLHNEPEGLRDAIRGGLHRMNHRAATLLGLPLDEFARRFPSFVKGSLRQSAACYVPPTRYEHTGGPALMLVPGLFCMPSVFNRLGRELERMGVDVYLPRPFPLARGVLANTCRLDRSAEMLVRDLQKLRRRHGVRRISLVGHSLGGLIVVRALAKAEADKRVIPRVEHVQVIASPLRGAPLTRVFRHFIPACRDMVPGCRALTALQSSMGHIDRVLVSGSDSLVPDLCQVAPGAERVYLHDYQHMDFYVGSPEQIRRTAEAIAAVLPNRRRRSPDTPSTTHAKPTEGDDWNAE